MLILPMPLQDIGVASMCNFSANVGTCRGHLAMVDTSQIITNCLSTLALLGNGPGGSN